MTHTLKTGLRGFTLIELLVVIAIIGLLSTVIAGPVQTGLKKGRDARKIADVKQIQSALAQYSADNGGLYPASLYALSPTYMATSSPSFYPVSSARDKIMYVTYDDAANNLVSYHLGVPLENQNVVLQNDADCDGMGALATNCANTGGDTTNYTNYAAGSAGGSTGATDDFNGAGSAENGGTCTNTLTTCIYDVTPQ